MANLLYQIVLDCTGVLNKDKGINWFNSINNLYVKYKQCNNNNSNTEPRIKSSLLYCIIWGHAEGITLSMYMHWFL